MSVINIADPEVNEHFSTLVRALRRQYTTPEMDERLRTKFKVLFKGEREAIKLKALLGI